MSQPSHRTSEFTVDRLENAAPKRAAHPLKSCTTSRCCSPSVEHAALDEVAAEHAAVLTPGQSLDRHLTGHSDPLVGLPLHALDVVCAAQPCIGVSSLVAAPAIGTWTAKGWFTCVGVSKVNREMRRDWLLREALTAGIAPELLAGGQLLR